MDMNCTRIAYTASLLVVGVGLAVNGYSQPFLTNGLVAYYPFNGNALDASGNGNNGIVHGVTVTADRFGSPASSYDFDGTNSYIDIPQNSVLNSLTSNLTLSAWIWQRGDIPDGYSIISKSETRFGNGWMFDTCNCSTPAPVGHRLRLQTGGNNSSCNVPGGTDFSMMQWHHVVATVSGTVGKVYLDGNLDGLGDVGNIPVNTLDVFIGYTHPTEGADLDAWFNGVIDDVRIYNRALSSNEVAQLYAIESGPRVDLNKAVKPSFFSLSLGTNYQMQISGDLNTWTNYGAAFMATNTSMVYPQYFDVDNWNSLFFRLQVSP
jgi:hypothetical protein